MISYKPGDILAPTSMRCKVSSKGRWKRQTGTLIRKASLPLHREISNNILYKRSNGVIDHVDDSVCLVAVPSLVLFLS